MCKENNHWFVINFNHHKAPHALFWVQHIDALPFRKLGAENNYSGVQIYNKVIPQLKALPDNLAVTKEYCDMERMSGILILEKQIKVKQEELKDMEAQLVTERERIIFLKNQQLQTKKEADRMMKEIIIAKRKAYGRTGK